MLTHSHTLTPALAHTYCCILISWCIGHVRTHAGHTCSLFPGHELLSEESRLVAFIENSPKLPPRRITLTYPALRRARAVFFVAAGGSKRTVLDAIRTGSAEGAALPAARVAPCAGGAVTWFVDEAAAGPAAAREQPIPERLLPLEADLMDGGKGLDETCGNCLVCKDLIPKSLWVNRGECPHCGTMFGEEPKKSCVIL